MERGEGEGGQGGREGIKISGGGGGSVIGEIIFLITPLFVSCL